VHHLRRISTRQLLAICAAFVVVICGGTALALAASSGGPKPASKPLANAVHDAITAPSPEGVTARVQFTNHLVDGVDIRGSNPLLSGATGRVWATKDGHFRLELQSTGGGGDAQIVSDGKSWWAYDGSSNTVYRGTVPQDRDHGAKHGNWKAPTTSRIQQEINRVMQHANISGPVPGDIAGQPAYTVRIEPKRNGGLLGALEFAWDANHGIPLRGAIYARGDSTPVLELKATEISFGPVDMSAFDIRPPAGAHTQNVSSGAGDHAGTAHNGHRHNGASGLAHVQRHTSFKIAAPATLAGRKRSSVDLIGGAKGKAGAVVTYGRGLGGIAVIQKPASAQADQNGPLAHAELPTVSVGGIQGQELSTPLGTVIRFERDGVSYVVLGSVPRAAVEAAARGL
jgi:outer membrane lipoprotein-sorting protein